MGSRHRRDRQRWLVVKDHQVVDRIYDCDLEEARRVSLRKWGAGARLTAWRYASAELRAAALRVPITHVVVEEPEPFVMRAAGGGR